MSQIHGILNINKPVGMTSHDVVARVRRILREKRVGHAGTLDPAAEGVLPVCVGQATRVVEYLSSARKIYCADVVLGLTTDTYDREGIVTSAQAVPDFSREEIEATLNQFRGKIEQIPPVYSAIKIGGQPAYKAARAGKSDEIELKSRQIEIFKLEISYWDRPWLKLWVECSKGTYIRSLAYDIGKALGCGAYMHHLVRVQVGAFHLKDAVTLEQLEEASQNNRLEEVLLQIDTVLTDMPAWIVNADTALKIKQGRDFPLAQALNRTQWHVAAQPDETTLYRRVYTQDGSLLALLEKQGQVWHPIKVLNTEDGVN
jgi:tRNA pseudouridine55 synthase